MGVQYLKNLEFIFKCIIFIFYFFEVTGIKNFYLPVLNRFFCIFSKLKTKEQNRFKKNKQFGYYFEENFALILNMHIFFRTELLFVFYRDFKFLTITFTRKNIFKFKSKYY